MAERKREQIEAELRTIIKGSKKSIFVKLSLTELIENSRRMYLIYNVHKSGEKFNLNNDDDKIYLLRKIDFDFQNLKTLIKKIPKPLEELLDRKWEKDPNSKHEQRRFNIHYSKKFNRFACRIFSKFKLFRSGYKYWKNL